MLATEKSMEQIVALCKGRGFVYAALKFMAAFQYMGLRAVVNLKQRQAGMAQKNLCRNAYNVGLDAAILMNPETWVASGHVGGFSDPLMDCKD